MNRFDAELIEALPEAAVLTAAPAPVHADWAAGVLRQHWCLHGTLESLSGERDANFLLRADDGTRWMLKLSHPDEDPLIADFQTQALLHVAAVDPDLPVQRLRPKRDGAASIVLADADGRSRVARVFSYLDGLPMPQAPRTAAQRLDVARMLARLDLALADLQHPAGARELPWDIQRADRVRPLLIRLADPARRTLALSALDTFELRCKPALAALRRQPIHNDFNPSNLLVDPADPQRVAGILDFGDMVHAPLVDDLAVAASYQIADGDALTAIAQFAAAYHAVLPLAAVELSLLLDLIRARLAMVVAISEWRAERNPANAGYLMRNNAVSWARLSACAALVPEQVQEATHAACRLAAATAGRSAETASRHLDAEDPRLGMDAAPGHAASTTPA